MGKKRCRSSYKSKGERRNIVNGLARRTEAQKTQDKLEAWKRGKNPWITVDRGGRASNERYYKVRANDIWGDPRKISCFYEIGRAHV